VSGSILRFRATGRRRPTPADFGVCRQLLFESLFCGIIHVRICQIGETQFGASSQRGQNVCSWRL
jgi:hypothetical protein